MRSWMHTESISKWNERIAKHTIDISADKVLAEICVCAKSSLLLYHSQHGLSENKWILNICRMFESKCESCGLPIHYRISHTPWNSMTARMQFVRTPLTWMSCNAYYAYCIAQHNHIMHSYSCEVKIAECRSLRIYRYNSIFLQTFSLLLRPCAASGCSGGGTALTSLRHRVRFLSWICMCVPLFHIRVCSDLFIY